MGHSANNFVRDFSSYSNGIDHLKRFVPGTRMLLVTAGLAVWAWYNHTVLVLVAIGGWLIASIAASLLDGLIVAHGRDTGELRAGVGASSDPTRSSTAALDRPHTEIADNQLEVSEVGEIRQLARTLSTECRILREAINRIDPNAIIDIDEIRWHDEHAEERYEDHRLGKRSVYDWPEPSIVRLENNIQELKRRLS